MTDWREELIEAMAKAAWPSDAAVIWEACPILAKQKHLNNARALLAVAEPVIREQADNALREENARLREALNGWQKWWELPWEGKRPDFAELVYRRAAAAIREEGKGD